MSGLRVLHTTGSLHARNGGPPRTISALAEGLGQAGATVEVLALADGPPAEAVRPDPELAQTTFVERGHAEARRFGHAVQSAGSDLVHDHGLWLPTNHAAARAARRQGVPFVVSTRGMLEPWARQNSRLKKSAAWWLYQRRDLTSAAVLHATAPSEAQALRSAGLRAPIAVIPNGVEVPPQAARQPRPPNAPRRALFLSRVHPKKGLPLLLDAWAEVRPAGWELVVAGPDEDGHQAQLETQAARLGLSEVSFLGSIDNDKKWDLYRSADLFVLPTYSENFGVVVAEALAAGVPVLTTTGAPWSELQTHRAGWWVEPSPRLLAQALRASTEIPDEERAAMGARGRALVADAYGWDGIAAQMLGVYEWLLGRQPSTPPCIHV